MLPTRDSFQMKGHIQTERGEKRYSVETKKKAGVVILTSDKIYFKIKAVIKERRALHNDKEVNPVRRYNICKYLRTQHKIPKYIKQIITDLKEKQTAIQ